MSGLAAAVLTDSNTTQAEAQTNPIRPLASRTDYCFLGDGVGCAAQGLGAPPFYHSLQPDEEQTLPQSRSSQEETTPLSSQEAAF